MSNKTVATMVLEGRRVSAFTLTPELAAEVNKIVKSLPKNTLIGDLYYNNNETWRKARKAFSRVQNSSITRALQSVTRITIQEASAREMDDFIGWKATKITAAFLFLCFRLE